MSAFLSRRGVLKLGAASVFTGSLPAAEPAKGKAAPTQFQIACMTLPYAQFPFERALSGIKAAGFKFVAWGHNHKEADGKNSAILPDDAPPEKAKEPAKRCRDLGLEPLMLFGPSPENVDALKLRIKQASAAGIKQVLTFGHTKGNDPSVWIHNLKELGPVARPRRAGRGQAARRQHRHRRRLRRDHPRGPR